MASTSQHAVKMTLRESLTGSRYFLPNRIQPFLVTMFQAIIVFKKIVQFLRTKIRKRIHRKSTELKKAMLKSQRDTNYTRSVGHIVREKVAETYKDISIQVG
jgi:hypothetical protein